MSKTLTFLGIIAASALGGAVVTNKSKKVRDTLTKAEEATDNFGKKAKMTVENLKNRDKKE